MPAPSVTHCLEIRKLPIMIDPYSEDVLWIVVTGFIMAFVLAFGLGSNDVANSFGTSVGSKSTYCQTGMLCGNSVCETAGSILLGEYGTCFIVYVSDRL
jgi:sodium-dependent phosphate transporter